MEMAEASGEQTGGVVFSKTHNIFSLSRTWCPPVAESETEKLVSLVCAYDFGKII